MSITKRSLNVGLSVLLALALIVGFSPNFSKAADELAGQNTETNEAHPSDYNVIDEVDKDATSTFEQALEDSESAELGSDVLNEEYAKA
ncbi:MAG: hypothetical protein HUJ62_07950, partial [Streptococcus gallolyticus]|nr:hypothetical protein [Streptococcus gallolyticus]